MSTPPFLQDLYFSVFRNHPFSTINRINTLIAKAIIMTNYGDRIWSSYDIPVNCEDERLIFIHIPKCAGKSIRTAIGQKKNRHFPSSFYLLSNRKAFSEARFFSVIRDPLDRIASILMHFRSSAYARKRERQIFDKLKISEENLEEYVHRFLVDRTFRHQLFSSTVAGRSGFSVSQADYITYQGKLLVKNIFSYERLDLLEKWLSSQLGEDISFSHLNSSKRCINTRFSEKTRDTILDCFPIDCGLYNLVSKSGGQVLEDDPLVTELEQMTCRDSKAKYRSS